VKACLLFVLNLPADSYFYNQVLEEWKESATHLSCYPEFLWGQDGSGEERQRSILPKIIIVEESSAECLNLSMGISQWAKWSRKGTERTAKIQNGSSHSHLHKPSTAVQAAKEERED